MAVRSHALNSPRPELGRALDIPKLSHSTLEQILGKLTRVLEKRNVYQAAAHYLS